MSDVLYTRQHQPVQLNQKIASGGEGEIWQTDRLDLLAKIFYDPKPQRLEKLQLMLQMPPVDPMGARGHISIAWPQELLFQKNGKFVGFLMPRVSGSLTLNNVYNAKLRNKKAPGFNWYYLHTAALNVASIVDALHARGYVVGDLKTDNFLINEKALVSVIDTDSFQVKSPQRTFRCGVASDGFTPPELIGKDMFRLNRLPQHDLFGLAVIIYMLLTGDHPFSGQWPEGREPLDRDEAISRGIWPYGVQSSLQLSPLALSLDDLFEPLKQAFLKTFNEGHQDPGKRITAREWCQTLSGAFPRLKVCAQNANHFYMDFKTQCTWCSRLKKLGYDAFPELKEASNLELVQGFMNAAEKSDYRLMLKRWRENPSLQKEESLASFRETMEQVAHDLKALDEFKELCLSEQATQQEILEVWQKNPSLHAFSTESSEKIDGKTIEHFLSALHLKNRELEHLKRFIKTCDARFYEGKAYVDDEKQLVVLADALKKKGGLDASHESLLKRVRLAKKRLQTWADFKGLWTQSDFDLFLSFQQHIDLVQGFGQVREVSDRLRSMEGFAKIFKLFEKKIIQKGSALELIQTWEAYPHFHESPFVTELLIEGSSLDEHIKRAYQKKALLETFQKADKQNELYQVADLWTASLCEEDPLFALYKTKLKKYNKEKYEWTRLRAAALEEEDEVVFENWSEAYTAAAYKENISEKIISCFKRVYGKKAVLHHSGQQRIFEHRDYWEILFPWPLENKEEDSEALQATHLIVCARSDRFPDFPDDIETPISYQVIKKPHSYAKYSTIFFPKTSSAPYFSVFPATQICGRIVEISKPICFKAPTVFPEVKYALFLDTKIAQTTSLYVQFFASEDLVIPSFAVCSHAERPLSFLDTEAEVMTEMESVSCKKGETLLKLTFDGPISLNVYMGLSIHDRSFYDKVRVTNLTLGAVR